jgi:hypothetical protein
MFPSRKFNKSRHAPSYAFTHKLRWKSSIVTTSFNQTKKEAVPLADCRLALWIRAHKGVSRFLLCFPRASISTSWSLDNPNLPSDGLARVGMIIGKGLMKKDLPASAGPWKNGETSWAGRVGKTQRQDEKRVAAGTCPRRAQLGRRPGARGPPAPPAPPAAPPCSCAARQGPSAAPLEGAPQRPRKGTQEPFGSWVPFRGR